MPDINDQFDHSQTPVETPTVEQLELFCLHIARGCGPGQAYIEAGLGKGTPCGDYATQRGVELLSDEVLTQRINALRVNEAPMGRAWVMQELRSVYYASRAERKYAVAAKVLVAIGSEFGMFVRTREPMSRFPRLSDMTNDELTAFIDEAQAQIIGSGAKSTVQ
jgi:hypothetical protein